MKASNIHRKTSALVISALALSAASSAASAGNDVGKRIVLAAIPSRIPAVRPDGRLETPERPGFRVEILRSAGKQCGAEVSFAPVPWARALDMVKNGGADAAFSASYSEERATYGVYPLNNGVPDPQKAMSAHIYGFYVHPDSELAWDGKTVSARGSTRKVLVESSSVAVGMAVQAGLEPLEVARYPNMVRMLAERRASGMIAINLHVEDVLAKDPDLARRIKRLDPPFAYVHGYVMFAKPFYVANTELVECFWKALGEIRAKPSYEALVKSYNEGRFIE